MTRTNGDRDNEARAACVLKDYGTARQCVQPWRDAFKTIKQYITSEIAEIPRRLTLWSRSPASITPSYRAPLTARLRLTNAVRSRTQLLALLASLCAASAVSANARFSLDGEFALGTDEQDVTFNLSSPVGSAGPFGISGFLEFRTWSHSGGVNNAGDVIPGGGFDPTLTLFDATATEIGFSDDGTGIVGNFDSLLSLTSPGSGSNALPIPVPAGDYTLRLGVLFDNLRTREAHHWALDLSGPDDVLTLDLAGLDTIDLVPGQQGVSRLTVVGDGSLARTTGFLDVGKHGAGVLRIVDGGRVEVHDMYIARNSGADGHVELANGSSLQTNYAAVGRDGTGVVLHSGGTHAGNLLEIAASEAGTGTYILSGGALTTANTVIGLEGNGTFEHSGGLHAVTATLYIGFGEETVGHYNLSGSGELSASLINFGAGVATFTQSGGTVATESLAMAIGGEAPDNRYSLMGGTLTSHEIIVGKFFTANFVHTGGTNEVTGELSVGGDVGVFGPNTFIGEGHYELRWHRHARGGAVERRTCRGRHVRSDGRHRRGEPGAHGRARGDGKRHLSDVRRNGGCGQHRGRRRRRG